MNHNGLLGEKILAMQQGKGQICVSIIVPTHKLSPERQTDHIEIKKAIIEAKEYLHYKYETENVSSLIKSLDELYNQIDFTHVNCGIGIFVSLAVNQLVYFSFPVTKKIIFG